MMGYPLGCGQGKGLRIVNVNTLKHDALKLPISNLDEMSQLLFIRNII